MTTRSSHTEVFLRKAILKICSKFTGEHPCRSVISIKLLCIRTIFFLLLVFIFFVFFFWFFCLLYFRNLVESQKDTFPKIRFLCQEMNLMSFWWFYFTLFFRVSVVDFEQVNFSWKIFQIFTNDFNFLSCLLFELFPY